MKSDHTRISRPIITLAALLGAATAGKATIIGFGQLGGNNTNIEDRNAVGEAEAGARNYGSNAVADGNGFVVSNGATPNVVLSWGPGTEWDVHTSDWFTETEEQTVGGGDWDNQGGVPRVGQLDYGNAAGTEGQWIVFSVDGPGYAVVLNSFDFGHTSESGEDMSTSWTLSLTDSASNVVWSQDLTLAGGEVSTVTPNFTGEFGETYTLTFLRTEQSYNSNGRHAIDNLSFNQVAAPGYAAWAEENVDGGGFDEDHDGDGIRNGLEYFFGTDPAAFTANPAIADGRITWSRDPAVADVSFKVQTSATLGVDGWDDVPAEDLDLSEPGAISYTLPAPGGENPRLFVRILATLDSL